MSLTYTVKCVRLNICMRASITGASLSLPFDERKREQKRRSLNERENTTIFVLNSCIQSYIRWWVRVFDCVAATAAVPICPIHICYIHSVEVFSSFIAGDRGNSISMIWIGGASGSFKTVLRPRIYFAFFFRFSPKKVIKIVREMRMETRSAWEINSTHQVISAAFQLVLNRSSSAMMIAPENSEKGISIDQKWWTKQMKSRQWLQSEPKKTNCLHLPSKFVYSIFVLFLDRVVSVLLGRLVKHSQCVLDGGSNGCGSGVGGICVIQWTSIGHLFTWTRPLLSSSSRSRFDFSFNPPVGTRSSQHRYAIADAPYTHHHNTHYIV